MRTEFRYGQKIQNLREQRAWTQEQLAGSADLDVRTIQRVEKDKTQNPETLQAIAGAFDVDLAALRKTFHIPESRLLGVSLLTTYEEFVGTEETHRHQAFVRAIVVSPQDNARIGDLWEQVFEDRELIEPDEHDLWKCYVESIREPLKALFDLGLGVFVVDQIQDLILPRSDQVKSAKPYIDTWRVRHFILVPRHGCFRFTHSKVHRFGADCLDGGNIVLEWERKKNGQIKPDKEDLGLFVYPNALPAVIESNGENAVRWCDNCFPQLSDGNRITFDYIQEVTGLTRAKLFDLYADCTGDTSLIGLS